jgi:hypothetical protein
LYGDLLLVDEKIDVYKEQIDSFYKRMLVQFSSYTPYMQLLSQDFPETGTIVVPFYDNSLYELVSLSSAMRWPTYGIITPDISNTIENELNVKDSVGNVFLPNTKRITSSVDGVNFTPTTFDDAELTNIFHAVDDEPYTCWWRDLDTTQGDIWVKVSFPVGYMNVSTVNAIAVHPIPEFGALLQSAHVEIEGNLTNLITLSNSVPDPTIVPLPWPALPTLFVIPSTRITSLYLHYKIPLNLNTAGIRGFGISHLGVYSLQWSSSASVTVDYSNILDGREVNIEEPFIINPDRQESSSDIISLDPVLSEGAIIGANMSLKTRGTGAPQVLRSVRVQFAED